jgi:hypothetical protein
VCFPAQEEFTAMSASTLTTDPINSDTAKPSSGIAAPAPTPNFIRGLMFALPLAGSMWVAIYCLARALF